MALQWELLVVACVCCVTGHGVNQNHLFLAFFFFQQPSLKSNDFQSLFCPKIIVIVNRA